MNEYPYSITIKKAIWSPEFNQWLKNSVGQGNFQYRKGQDNYNFMKYVFRREEDIVALKLRFGL